MPRSGASKQGTISMHPERVSVKLRRDRTSPGRISSTVLNMDYRVFFVVCFSFLCLTTHALPAQPTTTTTSGHTDKQPIQEADTSITSKPTPTHQHDHDVAKYSTEPNLNQQRKTTDNGKEEVERTLLDETHLGSRGSTGSPGSSALAGSTHGSEEGTTELPLLTEIELYVRRLQEQASLRGRDHGDLVGLYDKSGKEMVVDESLESKRKSKVHGGMILSISEPVKIQHIDKDILAKPIVDKKSHGDMELSISEPVKIAHTSSTDSEKPKADKKVPHGGMQLSISDPVKISHTTTDYSETQSSTLGENKSQDFSQTDKALPAHEQSGDSPQEHSAQYVDADLIAMVERLGKAHQHQEPRYNGQGSESSTDEPTELAEDVDQGKDSLTGSLSITPPSIPAQVTSDAPIQEESGQKSDEDLISILEKHRKQESDASIYEHVSSYTRIQDESVQEPDEDLISILEQHRQQESDVQSTSSGAGGRGNIDQDSIKKQGKPDDINKNKDSSHSNNPLPTTQDHTDESSTVVAQDHPSTEQLVHTSSTPTDDESIEQVDHGLFGEYGPTVLIVLGSSAAGLLLLLVLLVMFVLYYCSEGARARRKQRKLMTMNKDGNRWDPQVLRPSKESIDAFVFGSPMPSVSEMLTKY